MSPAGYAGWNCRIPWPQDCADSYTAIFFPPRPPDTDIGLQRGYPGNSECRTNCQCCTGH